MVPWTGPDEPEGGPSKKIFWRAGNASIAISPTEFLQGGRDTRRGFRGYVEILYTGKWVEKFQPLVVFNIILPTQLQRFAPEVEVFHHWNESLGKGRAADLRQRRKLPI
jgi:hypothetical protein